MVVLAWLPTFPSPYSRAVHYSRAQLAPTTYSHKPPKLLRQEPLGQIQRRIPLDLCEGWIVPGTALSIQSLSIPKCSRRTSTLSFHPPFLQFSSLHCAITDVCVLYCSKCTSVCTLRLFFYHILTWLLLSHTCGESHFNRYTRQRQIFYAV